MSKNMRYRRPKGRTIYTLDRLLEKQPKSLIRHRDYLQLMKHYRESPSLKKLKINRRCYSLLNDAVIKPEHMADFYRTYRLPRNPFFPLFLQIKSEYLFNREQKKRERQISIAANFQSLPPLVKKTFSHIKEMELQAPGGTGLPVYKKLAPRTKKQISAWSRYSKEEWTILFRTNLDILKKRYPSLNRAAEVLWAGFVLEILPESPGNLPKQEKVQSQYRKLCKIHHPDTGGDPELFIQLKEARDYFLEEGA